MANTDLCDRCHHLRGEHRNSKSDMSCTAWQCRCDWFLPPGHIARHRPQFEMEPHTTAKKSFKIQGPEDLIMYVDFDDVNHRVVDELASLVLQTLNRIPRSAIDAAAKRGMKLAEEDFEREMAEEDS